MVDLPDGLIVVCKRDCPTCVLVQPVLAQLAASGVALRVYSQDDPGFPEGLADVADDRALAVSYALNIETVPTLISRQGGGEVDRIVGWHRQRWQEVSGVPDLGPDLPDFRPGCGALNVAPGMPEKLAAKYDGDRLHSRRIQLGDAEDVWEACYNRGWSDGLPVVPPTPERVMRMLSGTRRDPQEVLGVMPPNRVPCNVEKVAVNAVMAGCLPEYMPVVLAAVEAALEDDFCLHGLVATTWFSTPVVVVSGPVARAIGMNSGVNALGQGNRANATIGRALQLTVRNVGGGVPGGIDRAVLGNPGKYTFCFAEDTENSPWTSLSESRGYASGTSTVTLFAGDGVQGVFDQQSRDPESLARSFAMCLQVVCHPKIVYAADALLVVTPEHARVFREAGWGKEHLVTTLESLLMRQDHVLVRGSGGIAEGIPGPAEGKKYPKFRPGGLNIVHAGGQAGLFSAVIGGWPASGPKGSNPVTKEILS
ncbi:MAG: thioredoxin family protein [Acidobacteriota bacterium]|nr:thioredoxin family protein [Acidobacteriota bacterium]